MFSGDPARLMRFVLEMRQAGVTDPRVLAALERTPRSHFAPEHFGDLAFDDIGLPLPHGLVMTKPSLIGRVLMALQAQPAHTVLEIGSGPGFQAGVLAQLAHTIVTLERRRDLAAAARGRLGTARLMRAFAHVGDGALGWPEGAPYDRIVLNVGVGEVPLTLLGQLKPDGILLAPVGDAEGQRLVRHRGGGAREDLGPLKLAMLEPGLAEEGAPGQGESE